MYFYINKFCILRNKNPYIYTNNLLLLRDKYYYEKKKKNMKHQIKSIHNTLKSSL